MTSCEKCGQDIDQDSAWYDTMCVLCWEAECAAEWWDVVAGEDGG